MRLGQKKTITAPPPPPPALVLPDDDEDDDESAGETLYDCLSAALEDVPTSTTMLMAQAFGSRTPYASLPDAVKALMDDAADVVWGDEDED